MRTLRITHNIIATCIRDYVHYPGRLAVDIMLVCARAGVTLLLYAYLFRYKGGSLGGTTFAPVAWSMFFYFALLMLHTREIARMIMEDVRSGAIEILFVRPINYVGYRMTWQIGSGLLSSVITLVVVGMILVLWVGVPAQMQWGGFVPTFILAAAGSVVVTLLLYTIIGLGAFWIEDISPLYWIVDKGVMMLGGAYFPVALFPPLMTACATWSPFGLAMLVPRTTTNAWATQWHFFLSVQAAWIVMLSVIVIMMMRAARRRVSINGG